ncbi:hypothetical protein RRG08_061722 [Elysia crispata]|uniref:Uncharacterized protein n=1 Tax=Elysia crispata TaxID=231223 RepID=A0AAE1DTH9_9GAST|nr:hypothetical protein RRG08_061722 [Elysia crispata]
MKVMTELGLAFDDDDLHTQKKKNNKDRDLPYCVKIVEPRWFDEETDLDDCSDQEPQVFKFRGDYRYRLKDYAGAADHYKAALGILPENNVAVNQDLRESLARCYAFMGDHIEALKLSNDLAKEMSVEDEARQRQSLILHAFVCEKACFWEECVQTLQKLCMLQPNFPQIWCQLGDAMSELTKGPNTRKDLQPSADASKSADCTSPEISRESEISRDIDWERKRNFLMSFIFYTRAKLLFESVMGNASNIIKMRNQKIIAEISEKIDNLPLSNDLRQKACQIVPRHIEFQFGDSTKESKVASMEDYEDPNEHQNVYKHGNISDLFYLRFFKCHKNDII